VLLLAPALAAARVPCAGDGPPIYAQDEGLAPRRLPPVLLTAGATLALDIAGGDARRLNGDFADGTGVDLLRARIGVCGSASGLLYRLVWEPYDADERAHLDAQAWGRIVEAQAGWAPTDWLGFFAGVGKVPIDRGREEPAGALPLPWLPLITADVAPDRRLGLTGWADMGVIRAGLGVYEGARLASLDDPGGLLLSARAELEPWGPVGTQTWPEFPAAPPAGGSRSSASTGDWTDRPRPSTGLSGAYLRRNNVSSYLAGADFAFAWKRLFAVVEALYAYRWPLERATPTPGALASRLGAFLEALVQVWRPWLSLAGRVEYLDENLAEPGRGKLWALEGGANLYVFGPSLMLQAAYAHKFHLDLGTLQDDLITLSLTLSR
jgi:hypothetical protein